jgi:hypothetical protein
MPFLLHVFILLFIITQNAVASVRVEGKGDSAKIVNLFPGVYEVRVRVKNSITRTSKIRINLNRKIGAISFDFYRDENGHAYHDTLLGGKYRVSANVKEVEWSLEFIRKAKDKSIPQPKSLSNNGFFNVNVPITSCETNSPDIFCSGAWGRLITNIMLAGSGDQLTAYTNRLEELSTKQDSATITFTEDSYTGFFPPDSDSEIQCRDIEIYTLSNITRHSAYLETNFQFICEDGRSYSETTAGTVSRFGREGHKNN